MYHAGIAINGDIERAYLWSNLAAAQGVESAVSARDLVVRQLTSSQIVAMQQEAIRISRGYHSSYVPEQSKSVIIESDPVVEDSTYTDEPIPGVNKQTAKSLFPRMKDWLKKNLF